MLSREAKSPGRGGTPPVAAPDAHHGGGGGSGSCSGGGGKSPPKRPQTAAPAGRSRGGLLGLGRVFRRFRR
jgi:hypothetical protein